jgi:hypothetical protein
MLSTGVDASILVQVVVEHPRRERLTELEGNRSPPAPTMRLAICSGCSAAANRAAAVPTSGATM